MRYIFLLLFVFFTYLAYILIKPFFTALAASAMLTYIFYPIYSKIAAKLRSKTAASFIVSMLVILLIAVPSILMLNSAARESQFLYVRTKQMFTTGDLFNLGCVDSDYSRLCMMSNFISTFTSRPDMNYHIQTSIEKMTTSLSDQISGIIFSIPTIFLGIFVTFFTMYYLFKDGKGIISKIKRVLPLNLSDQRKVFQKLNDTTHAIIYGSILVAVAQGIVGGVGYLFFGISSPIIWGLLTAIFSLIPVVGTAIIWVPMSIILIIQGHPWAGIGLLAYGAIIISSMDNLLRPLIIGKKAKIHPVIVLLGVLGGIAVFGFLGFVIGPLILAMFMTFLEIYENGKITPNIKA